MNDAYALEIQTVLQEELNSVFWIEIQDTLKQKTWAEANINIFLPLESELKTELGSTNTQLLSNE